MATKSWIGSVSGDPSVAGNWDPAVALADGDVAVFDDNAQRGMDGADYGNAIETALTVIVEPGFVYGIGSSGTPLAFNNFPEIRFRGAGVTTSYFSTDCAAGDDQGADIVVVDSLSAKNTIIDLAGTVGRLIGKAGRISLDSGITVSTQILIDGAELTIPSGGAADLSATRIVLDKGLIDCNVNTGSIQQNGGVFVLGGTGDIDTRLDMSGGEFIWDSANSGAAVVLVLLEIHGGKFWCRKARVGRTITNANIYGDAIVDLSRGGLAMTISNPIRFYGKNRPNYPTGTQLTAAS